MPGVPACEAAVQQYPNSSRLNYQLGRSYHKANNFVAAVAQYRKAAGQSCASAQSNLGVMSQLGFGVPQDYGEALKSSSVLPPTRAMRSAQGILGCCTQTAKARRRTIARR